MTLLPSSGGKSYMYDETSPFPSLLTSKGILSCVASAVRIDIESLNIGCRKKICAFSFSLNPNIILVDMTVTVGVVPTGKVDDKNLCVIFMKIQ